MTTQPGGGRPTSLDDAAILRRYLGPRWLQAVLLSGLLFVSIGLQLAIPQILRTFIDLATIGAPIGQISRLGVVFLAIAVAGQLIAVAEAYVAESLGQATINELRADLLRHCLGLDLGFHYRRTPGELIERVDGDVANLANFFSRFAVQVLGNAILLLGILALLFGVSLTIGAAISVITLVATVVLVGLRDAGVPRMTAARQASAELFGFLEERLVGTEDLRASGALEHTLRRLADRSEKLFRAERFAAFVATATGFSANLFLTVITVVGLALSALAFYRGEISIGSVYLVFSYTQILGRPLQQMSRQVQDLQLATM